MKVFPRQAPPFQSGFTLLEVIIATAILAILSIYTAESVHNAVKSKVKVEKKVGRVTAIYDVLRIMERDINMAFHYRDINIDLYNLAERERMERKKEGTNTRKKSNQGRGQSKDQQRGAPKTDSTVKEFKPKEHKILTHFLGEENKLDFTTLNYTRIRSDDMSSDQAEVGYFLKGCRNRFNKKKKSECLWRRIDPIIDDDVSRGGIETVLLENVERFELRYLGPGKEEEWMKHWKTNQEGNATTQETFPYAVEITLEYHQKDMPGEKPVSITTVAAIRFPNNRKPEEKNGQAQGSISAPPPGTTN